MKLCKHFIFTDWTFGATLQRASPQVPLLQQNLLTLMTVSQSAALTPFQTFSLFSCLQWWPMINDARCSYWTCFGMPGTSIIWVNLADDVVCVLTAPQTPPTPSPPPLLRPPCSLRHNTIGIRAMNSPTIAAAWSTVRKSQQCSRLHAHLIAHNCCRHPCRQHPPLSSASSLSIEMEREQLSEAPDDS